MKDYPSIESTRGSVPAGFNDCLGFYKYDGSNLRWEWRPKRGFYKFGSRKRLFDKSDPMLGPAIELFQDTVAKELAHRMLMLRPKIEEFTAYTEYFGASSFAGRHDNAEAKSLKLIDVWEHKQGFLKPSVLYTLTSGTSWEPTVIMGGALTYDYLQEVRDGTVLKPEQDGPPEGAVFKAWDPERKEVKMIKIKTVAYLKRLQETFGRDWIKYE